MAQVMSSGLDANRDGAVNGEDRAGDGVPDTLERAERVSSSGPSGPSSRWSTSGPAVRVAPLQGPSARFMSSAPAPGPVTYAPVISAADATYAGPSAIQSATYL